jgi:hypothetical protein
MKRFISAFTSLSRAKLSLALLTFLLASMPVLSVFAHQQKAAITRIELNPRTNMLEVMHRFELHDAEHAVKEVFDGSADIIQSKETQSQFAHYVIARFGIYYPNNDALPITLVGFETEGKHFWIYQETPKPESLAGLQIVHNALRDIWFAQTNTVNVKLDKEINTLTFTDNTEVLKIDFAH